MRQGGVLSPTLFAIYVNDVLNGFTSCGACFKGLSVSAIMYADDIVLLSPSVTELQQMLNYLHTELSMLDIKINVKKSNAIRIGNRFASKCDDLCVKESIPWSKNGKIFRSQYYVGKQV